MTNAVSLRGLIIYAFVLPLAILLGYLLATPLERPTLLTVALVLGALMLPLFLRWHHPILVLTWNLGMMLNFLPGQPQAFLPACAISFLFSILHHALNRRQKFLSVPAVTWPLLALLAVATVTAHFTGGFGLRATGSATYGGRRYIALFAAVAGYFALTSGQVPTGQGPLYMKLYLLPALTNAIASLSGVVGPGFYWLFLLFPGDQRGFAEASNSVLGDMGGGLVRLEWMAGTCGAIPPLMLALYGLRGVVELRHPWRMALFLTCAVASLLGGFRSALISLLVTLALQFYFEGMFRSRKLPAMVLLAALAVVVAIPFSNRLPLPIQRAISFLPFDVDPAAKSDAEGSTDWRLAMWQRAFPEVPNHLLLGKGYSLDPVLMASLDNPSARGIQDPWEVAYQAGDYHNGPLSVILTFGLGGAFAFLAFLYGCIRTLYCNYRYGPAELKKINTFLLCAFITKTFMFFVIFGSLYSELMMFTGMIGMGVCLNGGVRTPVPAPVLQAKPVLNHSR